MKLKISTSVLSRWASDEYASWEDDGCPDQGHVYNILTRHRSLIEIRTPEETATVLKSGEHWGDPYSTDDAPQHARAVKRIISKIKETK